MESKAILAVISKDMIGDSIQTFVRSQINYETWYGAKMANDENVIELVNGKYNSDCFCIVISDNVGNKEELISHVVELYPAIKHSPEDCVSFILVEHGESADQDDIIEELTTPGTYLYSNIDAKSVLEEDSIRTRSYRIEMAEKQNDTLHLRLKEELKTLDMFVAKSKDIYIENPDEKLPKTYELVGNWVKEYVISKKLTILKIDVSGLKDWDWLYISPDSK